MTFHFRLTVQQFSRHVNHQITHSDSRRRRLARPLVVAFCPSPQSRARAPSCSWPQEDNARFRYSHVCLKSLWSSFLRICCTGKMPLPPTSARNHRRRRCFACCYGWCCCSCWDFIRGMGGRRWGKQTTNGRARMEMVRPRRQERHTHPKREARRSLLVFFRRRPRVVV